MQCRDVAGVVEQEGLDCLPETAVAHLAECPACQGFISDLTSIVNLAHEVPAEVEPPARIWISLRAQLEQEGLISSPVHPAVPASAWWHSLSELFRSRTLAVASVGLIIVIAGMLQLRKSEPQVAPARLQVQAPTAPITAQSPARAMVVGDASSNTAIVLDQQEQDLSNMQLADTSPVDTSLRQNLREVNAFIADCERRLKEEPRDELAREYLDSAYRQKAVLLSAMMDRGGNLN
ncbi:MAG: hypothetical protein NVS9B4_16470 [Candidatus Acidiferrum sp.]